MKRSEINRIIEENIQFMKKHQFLLPPFAFWSPEEWKTKEQDYDEIRENGLGWDVTDFGSGDFEKQGLFLFTIRNGNQKMKQKYIKPYAEKIMVVNENQITPYHFHFQKMEDIINRGGGNLMVQLYNSTADKEMADTPVKIYSDGRTYEVPAGTVIRLKPGESIGLHVGQYHSFWGEEGFGKVLVGEVSECNDDAADNRFYENIGRFPAIEEDVPPRYHLVDEYHKA
jgi:D-lyxose ketol-isomerase